MIVENKLFSNNDLEPTETVLPARIDRVDVCALVQLCGEQSMANTVGQ